MNIQQPLMWSQKKKKYLFEYTTKNTLHFAYKRKRDVDLVKEKKFEIFK